MSPVSPATLFSQLPLDPALVAALEAHGVTEPFPIQAATLPDSLAGRDVLGRGRTGSGKTLAFGLPLLVRTKAAGRRAEPKRPLALVLVPTRELAGQVTEALEPYAKVLGLRITAVVGGASINRQSAALKAGAEVLVATPGRLADLIDRRACALDRVAVTVLDEADQMADMGFLPQVTKLLEQVRADGQRMLFSATLDRNVDKLVKRFLTAPVTHSVDPSAATVTTMEHHVLHVDEATKRAVTAEIAARKGGVIMFVGTKRGADRLTKHLLGQGVRAVALHGGKSQPQRNRALDQFRTGTADALVATNVAARGIHIDGLDLVVNVDPPTEAKDYLHRGGRTARAGESGTVVTLVLPEQRRENARLMAAAGIRPATARVRPGDPDLARITGARKPSGTPVAMPAALEAAPAKPASSASAPRRRAGTNPAGRRTGPGVAAGRGGATGRRARGESGTPRGRRAA
ncbi:DEAD/DEAH box helicase [Actinacidiphila paucisporea]|uniref:Superfamily II DNA and RNA helicase n=1 Tax=Actinacidiphila paucisporea TaxID=310782 RepID=A0A1M7QKX4_9ACTN|nr:DEAD/DEAH box helicase [Actinacidiphila paucisporea]SHN31927.1 Superfamily II DNA and RNA helicase [Actinacidiphila paucisporea]